MIDDREQQLDQIIADFLQARDSGQAVTDDDLIAAHPEFADELREFLNDLGQMDVLPGAEPVAPREPLLDKLRYFGKYELIEEIARGGMGVVYKARQTNLNRIVAIKMILSGHLASEEDVKRFRTEAEAAANLQHPGIVAVHEVDLHKGQHYFSMDYIDGRDLAKVVRENPLPARKAAEYVQEIAKAVQYAHQQGTLHRDLKPSNILIDSEGNVHVTDFGLAMRVEGDSELTRTGQVLGTPAYMAPEQAQGKRGLIGPGSDVYSMGVILYELLTGRPPFKAESSVETLRQVTEDEPVSPRLLSPKVPRNLETICLKCLQKEPHKRYLTAEELAEDVGRFLNGEPILARPVGRIERTWRWCRRNPVVAGLNAALATVILIGFAGITVQWFRAEEALSDLRTEQSERAILEGDLTDLEARRRELKQEFDTQNESLREVNASLKEGQAQLADNLITQTEDAVRREMIGTARQLLRRCPVDWRDHRWHALNQRIDQEGRVAEQFEPVVRNPVAVSPATVVETEISLPKDVSHLTLSPDQKRLAYVDGTDNVRIWDVTEKRQLPAFHVPYEIDHLTFCADGTRLACQYSGYDLNSSVVIWNVVTCSKEYFLALPSADLPSANVPAIGFSTEGQKLIVELDRGVRVWDVPPIENDASLIVSDIATLDVGIHEWPQAGGSRFRNNAPMGAGIPAVWDIESGKNILWKTRVVSSDYWADVGEPVVANGRIYIGANNDNQYLSRYPRDVDLGVLLCLHERTGGFLWQHSNRKLTSRFHDWNNAGICASPVVDGDRLFVVTNRCEVVCLDTEGFTDDENDGPFTGEDNEHRDEADVIWKLDMIEEFGVSPRYVTTSSILIDGDRLFLCTGNGVDRSIVNIPAPDAPSFIALERDSGDVIWTDNSPGKNILNGQWASPAYGVFDGQPQVIFGGGDGWLYSFDPAGDGHGNSRLLWKFDCNPKTAIYSLRGGSTRGHIMQGAVVCDGLVYVAVGHDNGSGNGRGHLWCIDPTKRGDVSAELALDRDGNVIPPRRMQCVDVEAGETVEANTNSAAVWHFTGEDANRNGKVDFAEQMYRASGGPAIRDGKLYIGDFEGVVHCLNAKTGAPYWSYDMISTCFGSPLVVDGKVYVGNEDGNVFVFEHGRELKILAKNDMGSSVIRTPIVANNVLYIASKNMLYAIADTTDSSE